MQLLTNSIRSWVLEIKILISQTVNWWISRPLSIWIVHDHILATQPWQNAKWIKVVIKIYATERNWSRVSSKELKWYFLFRPVNEWCAIESSVKNIIWRVNRTPTIQQVCSVIFLQIVHLQLHLEFPFVEIYFII